ncbi:MAG: response regulator containing a CheY-like receiver domain and an DNA-binding domain [Microbacteriaceae bacterium]|jgi:DNA-binding NarL/FixJ family response regulator|nr:response regulator containing a CheY-like receiver domain and an DNA-binding domain [Microbacteriaceae bacterium]
MTQMIRVLVADDQAAVRDGLVTVLSLVDGIEVVGEAVDGEQAVESCAVLAPDVVLMDLRMPVLGGAEATARIVAAQPSVAVLVLTTYADDESILGALRAGARGYLTKDAGRAELEAAIRSVARGQATFAPGVGARLIEKLAPARPLGERFPTLTARELEVLELIVTGMSNPEIAAAAFISVATVKTHVNSIFAKLGVTDRAKLIALVR